MYVCIAATAAAFDSAARGRTKELEALPGKSAVQHIAQEWLKDGEPGSTAATCSVVANGYEPLTVHFNKLQELEADMVVADLDIFRFSLQN
mmetsp:Transcript_35155/g.58229  ORF Transcript_35155/g.58229 Transcript_35155/m.58229 type:complete len:91 (-) Transcript_35155:563-835(-)